MVNFTTIAGRIFESREAFDMSSGNVLGRASHDQVTGLLETAHDLLECGRPVDFPAHDRKVVGRTGFDEKASKMAIHAQAETGFAFILDDSHPQSLRTEVLPGREIAHLEDQVSQLQRPTHLLCLRAEHSTSILRRTEKGNMSDPLDLEGKIVVVTGGTMGAGKGIALRFLEVGAEVIICARNEPTSPVAVDEREAFFIPANVRKLEDIDRVIENVMERHKRLDVLVNNAGGSPPVSAATASPRFSASIIDLNLIAPLNFAQKANAIMQKQDDGGCIINIGSVSGARPSPETAAYGAAKAGLLNLTTSLAVEWAPKVRVNAVAAGMILTEKAEIHFGTGKTREAVEKTAPMGRMALPRDVANTCVFLASPLASYVTGASILVHGGGEWPAFLRASKGDD